MALQWVALQTINWHTNVLGNVLNVMKSKHWLTCLRRNHQHCWWFSQLWPEKSLQNYVETNSVLEQLWVLLFYCARLTGRLPSFLPPGDWVHVYFIACFSICCMLPLILLVPGSWSWTQPWIGSHVCKHWAPAQGACYCILSHQGRRDTSRRQSAAIYKYAYIKSSKSSICKSKKTHNLIQLCAKSKSFVLY